MLRLPQPLDMCRHLLKPHFKSAGQRLNSRWHPFWSLTLVFRMPVIRYCHCVPPVLVAHLNLSLVTCHSVVHINVRGTARSRGGCDGGRGAVGHICTHMRL